MDINTISKISFNPELLSSNSSTQVNSGNNIFGSILDSYLDTYKNASVYENESINNQLAYATGKTDDMLSVIMAQEKAYTSLNFAVQVTNKIVESYKQIMQIQL